MKRSLLPILIASLLFLVIVIALSSTGRGALFFALFDWIPHYDKIGHFFLMGILAFLAVVAIAPRTRFSAASSSFLVIAAVLFITTAEEISQNLFSQRTASLTDLSFSTAGILSFGVLAHFLFVQRRSNEVNQPESSESKGRPTDKPLL